MFLFGVWITKIHWLWLKSSFLATFITCFLMHNVFMNKIVSLRRCEKYDVECILSLLRTFYRECNGCSLKGKRVLIKPNILSDRDPNCAVTTHPVFVEAVIRFVQEEGAQHIVVGDAPAIHGKEFIPRKCGIYEVCQRTGVEWAFFGKEVSEINIGRQWLPVAKIAMDCDVFISVPKLKTHGLMLLTGGIKNTFGIIPQLHKARQHAFYRNADSFASFLVDLNERITPDFIFMDGIKAMEGDGPSNGRPMDLGVVLASTNPLAIDIAAASLVGYLPDDIPTIRTAISRGKWLSSYSDIEFYGEVIDGLRPSSFQLVRRSGIDRIVLNFLKARIPFSRRLERRPIFNRSSCSGCRSCLRICPVHALVFDEGGHKVCIDDRLCIRCFCCQEVCPEDAITIKRKLF